MIVNTRGFVQRKRKLTIPREMKAHVLAAHPLPRLWYIAVMNSGIAAPEPERMTVFAASADAT